MAEAQPRYSYAPAARRYRDAATGRFVPKAAVGAAVDAVVADSAERMRAATQQLRDGQVTLAQWQQQTAAIVKAAHVDAAAFALGGWDHASPAQWGAVGQRLRQQYAYLQGFANDIASGKQPLDGTALTRASLYGEAGRSTHREMLRRLGAQMGDAYERNVLGAADHCPGCLEQTRRGVVPVGTLVPVGARDCLTRCHCVIETVADPNQEAA